LVDTFPFGGEDVAMPRTRPPYPDEYRQRILELHRSGRSIESLAREFEPSANTISKWVKQSRVDAGEIEDGLTTDERAELRRLRRENRRLKLEREILEKAAAWFAREAGSIPERDSDS
jgi:transposase